MSMLVHMIQSCQVNVMLAEKTVDHKAGSLGFLVNNLVKNWEKEASYKVKGSK